MVPVACQLGLCSCHEQYSVVLSDEDGEDVIQLFKDELDGMMGNPELYYTPVPFYVTTGTIGNLHAEGLVVFLHAGIPFILSSAFSIDGAGLTDAVAAGDGGRLVAGLYGKNNRHLYSLGFIDHGENPLEYARICLSKSPPMESPDIDAGVAEEHILRGKFSERVGVISKDGGTRLEIYAFDTDESRMIRANKDFGDNPYSERGIPEGMVEVIAYGGNPDIICIGALCAPDGSMFDVWVPNVPVLAHVARRIFEEDGLPYDAFSLDTASIEECYARFHLRLKELEDEAIDREIAEDGDADAPPDIVSDEEP